MATNLEKSFGQGTKDNNYERTLDAYYADAIFELGFFSLWRMLRNGHWLFCSTLVLFL